MCRFELVAAAVGGSMDPSSFSRINFPTQDEELLLLQQSTMDNHIRESISLNSFYFSLIIATKIKFQCI